MVENRRSAAEKQFEKDLYIIRRRIEKAVQLENIVDFYSPTPSKTPLV